MSICSVVSFSLLLSLLKKLAKLVIPSSSFQHLNKSATSWSHILNIFEDLCLQEFVLVACGLKLLLLCSLRDCPDPLCVTLHFKSLSETYLACSTIRGWECEGIAIPTWATRYIILSVLCSWKISHREFYILQTYTCINTVICIWSWIAADSAGLPCLGGDGISRLP